MQDAVSGPAPPAGAAACTLDGGNPPPPAPQVNVGEDEPEDIAVRKFMKKVMESGIIDEVRWWRACG